MIRVLENEQFSQDDYNTTYYYTVEFGDDNYDYDEEDSYGSRTRREYGEVQLGDAMKYVKSQLGREYYEDDWTAEEIIECYAELKWSQGLGCDVYDIKKAK